MIRYRQLSGRPDEAARAVIRDAHLAKAGSDADSGTAAMASTIAAVSAPVAVSVYEGQASLEEVGRLLLQRKLSPRDLVDGGTGWTTIDEFLPLSDQVQRYHAADRRKRLILAASAALALAAASAVIAWLLSRGD